MKRLSLALALAALIGAQGAAAQPVTIRIATFLPPKAFFTGKTMPPWMEAIEKDSGGAVKFEMFAGGTLGAAGRDPRAQLKMVTDGVADLTFVIPQYVSGRFPEDRLFNLPLLAESSFEASMAAWGMYEAGLLGGYDDPAYKIVALYVNPPNVLHLTSPVKSLDDLKGKQVQTGGPEQQEITRALGAVPVGTVSVREVAEALSRGVVQGTLKDWLALYSFRIDRVAKHHVQIPLGSASIMLPLNKAKYDALPAAAKAAIDKHSGRPLVQRTAREFDEANEGALAKAKAESGRAIVVLPAEERKRWEAQVRAVIDAYRKESAQNEKLYQAYVKAIGEVRAKK